MIRQPTPTEHEEQCSLMEWCSLMVGTYPELRWIFAVPNGSLRHPAVARKLKAEGVQSGIPDLLLLIPRGPFHGLALEMKTQTGKLSPEQKHWIGELTRQGYYTAVAYGWVSAKTHLEHYLNLGKKHRITNDRQIARLVVEREAGQPGVKLEVGEL